MTIDSIDTIDTIDTIVAIVAIVAIAGIGCNSVGDGGVIWRRRVVLVLGSESWW